MAIEENKIIEIRKSVNIVDIISNYIPVQAKGRNYFAVCPFHDDHNPSMSISVEKQIYTCFVCGAHGNVFNFIMDYENVSFYEALKLVADKSGIPLDIGKYQKKVSSTLLDDYYQIYDFANKYYQNNLFTKDGSFAREYLENRQFSSDIIKEFGIGLSLNSKLTNALLKKYSNETLIKSGISNSKNDILFDTFVNRIMFPLWDIEGRVVGFSGRIYKESDDSKYINSKESEIFKKGKIIYNYHRAKDEIRKKKCVIVVEGFMDVIALYKVGVKNVVAMMGTAVTSEQSELLKRLSSNIILCFDGDNAGNMATISCANELSKVGIIPNIIRLPNNMDPDEYVKEYGVDSFNEYVDNPKSLLDYKISYYKEKTDFTNSTDVSKYINDVCNELYLCNDKIVRELTIQKLSDETSVSVATIKSIVKGFKKNNVVIKKNVVKYDKYQKAEMRLIFYMLRSKEVINMYINNKCYMPTKECRYLASELISYSNSNEEFCIADFITYLSDKEELLKVFNEIDTLNICDSYSYDEIIDYINLLNNYNLNKKIKDLTEKFKKEIDSNIKEKIALEISKLKVSE